MTNIDFFERPELLPKKVRNIIDNFGDCDTYMLSDKLLKKLNKLGYTFDYYLDATPYNLRKIKCKP